MSIEKNNYMLTNTCAFDSVLQLFVAGYFDFRLQKNLIEIGDNLKFFELIREMASCGVKKQSYRLRA